MKKLLYTVLFLSALQLGAQTKNVGINTSTPEATLEIKNLNTAATAQNAILRIGNTTGNSNHLFRVMHNGYLVSGRNSSHEWPIIIYPLTNDHADFAVVDTDNPNAFLKHYHMNTGSELAAYGSPTDRSGHVFVFSSGGNNSGFFIGPFSDRKGGLYVGEDGKNGIGVSSMPTEVVDIEGGMRIGLQQPAPVAGVIQPQDIPGNPDLDCLRPGEIAYYNGFWGCTSTGWKKIDN